MTYGNSNDMSSNHVYIYFPYCFGNVHKITKHDSLSAFTQYFLWSLLATMEFLLEFSHFQ